MKNGKWFISIFMVLTVFAGCSKPDNDELLSSKAVDPAAIDQAVYYSSAKGAEIPATKFPVMNEFCGFEEYNFIAGQTKNAGYVLVGNTKDSLFIEVTSTEGFQDKKENVKIWIGATMPFTDRPSAGLFPFKYDVARGDTAIYIGFSLEELGLKCDAAFYIVIHGDVLAPGEETAFAGNISGPGSSWWYYIHYTPKCCEPPVICKISATTEVLNVKCFGSSTGAINLTVLNGTAPFSYLWSNAATSEDLSGIPAGTYSVTVTDANKCVATVNNILVLQPSAGVSANRIVTNISSYGAKDGAIDVTVTGGTPSYTFLWNTGATSEDLSGLEPGTYSVLITDANGCNTELKGILVEQPDEEKPKGAIAFARKTYKPMVHCFMGLDMDENGTPDFTTWGWTNGAMPEDEIFISKYELFIGASGCDDMSNATKVGDVQLHHFNGTATATITMLPGYTLSETALYIGNDMLPKTGGSYTIDPANYPHKHLNLGGVATDKYVVPASGDVFIITYARVLQIPDNK